MTAARTTTLNQDNICKQNHMTLTTTISEMTTISFLFFLFSSFSLFFFLGMNFCLCLCFCCVCVCVCICVCICVCVCVCVCFLFLFFLLPSKKILGFILQDNFLFFSSFTLPRLKLKSLSSTSLILRTICFNDIDH